MHGSSSVAQGDQRNDDRARRSKEDLLVLAAELANEAPPTGSVRHHAVAHVSLAAVAEAAGVSRGALYRLWPTQEEFWSDLVELIMAEDSDRSDADSADATQRPRSGSHAQPHAATTSRIPSLPRWVERDGGTDPLVDAVQCLLLLDRAHLLRAGVAGYPVGSSSDAGNVNTGRVAARVDELSEQIESVFTVDGVRCLDGLTPTDVSTAIVAIGRGLPIIGRLADRWELRVHDASLATEPGTPRSLLGVTFDAIRTELTVPAGKATSPLRRHGEPPGRDERRWTRSNWRGDESPDAIRGPSGRRRDYLQLAAKLVTDEAVAYDGLSRAAGHVTLDALARAATVSRQTLTNMWPDQAAFRLDLFSHLLDRERRWVSAAIADATTRAAERIEQQGRWATGLGIVRGIGDQIHVALSNHVSCISFLAFAPFLAAREVADAVRRRHHDLVDDTARQLAVFLRTIGRRPRRGVTWRQIALALFALADGTNHLLRTSPDLVSEDIIHDDSTHTLTGFAGAAILTHLTEVDDADFSAADFVALIF